MRGVASASPPRRRAGTPTRRWLPAQVARSSRLRSSVPRRSEYAPVEALDRRLKTFAVRDRIRFVPSVTRAHHSSGNARP